MKQYETRRKFGGISIEDVSHTNGGFFSNKACGSLVDCPWPWDVQYLQSVDGGTLAVAFHGTDTQNKSLSLLKLDATPSKKKTPERSRRILQGILSLHPYECQGCFIWKWPKWSGDPTPQPGHTAFTSKNVEELWWSWNPITLQTISPSSNCLDPDKRPWIRFFDVLIDGRIHLFDGETSKSRQCVLVNHKTMDIPCQVPMLQPQMLISCEHNAWGASGSNAWEKCHGKWEFLELFPYLGWNQFWFL